jgi:single-strand DNA-binding protein
VGEGQLQTREYTDRDGDKRRVAEVVLQRYQGALTLLDSNKESSGSSRAHEVPRGAADIVDDDIPFP